MNAAAAPSPRRAGAPIRVALADDHRLVREGLAALLAREGDMQVVGSAADGLDALRLARELDPDVLVTDVSMPGLNGIEAVRRLHAEIPSLRVLCVSMHDDRRTVLGMLQAGAGGYVLKDSSGDELAGAIRRVMAQQVYLSPPLVTLVVDGLRAQAAAPAATADPSRPAASPLTPRERELVQLMSEGYSTAGIAERLHVSTKTVATHREHVMHKLGLGSIAELTRWALREGLTNLDTPCGARRDERAGRGAREPRTD